MQGRSFQVCIAVGSAKARLAHRLRNLVQAIDGTVDPVVPDFQHGQPFVLLVQLLGEAVYAGAPIGILSL